MKFLENPEDSHKKVKKAEKRRSADGKKGREGVKKRIRKEKKADDESSDESSGEKDDGNDSDDEEEEKEEVAPIKIKKRVSFEDEQDELPKEEEEKEEEVSVEHTEEKASDSDDGHEVENELPSEVVASIEKKQSDEEREHATELMRVQNLRGGRVVLQDIQKPEKEEWTNALDAFQTALSLEKFNNECLLKLHSTASNHNDAHLTDYIEEKYLDEQVKSINEFAHMVTALKRLGPGMGEYIFDKEHFD